MKASELFQRHEDPGRDKAIYRYAARHDYFAELEQLAWKRGEDAAGIEAGDIARLLLRAYKAESDDPEEGDRAKRSHELAANSGPRWRNRPIGGPA